MTKSRRLNELDVLIGIASVSVVMYHSTSGYNHYYGHSQDVKFYFTYDPYGVDLFFMISGFVILMSLDFIVARFSRLYPAYLIAVILTFSTVAMASSITFLVEQPMMHFIQEKYKSRENPNQT